ncbi:MAG: hypothetical protein C0624_13410 [Desulfuromonas sp.]|nr:MAG: hypothetical protein C0624_13410 [Desulfuromonas sp.]
MSKFALTLSLILFALPAYATDQMGQIAHTEGKVLHYSAGSARGKRVKDPGTQLQQGDTVATKRGSQADVLFIDGNRVVVQENSILEVKGLQTMEVANGTVLFDIRKRGELRGFEVTSGTVTMGVRGTRFAVRSKEGRLEVGVTEGKVEVSSSTGPLRKRKPLTMEEQFKEQQEEMRQDFEKSIEQMEAQFEESKRLMAAGDFEAVEKIDLEAGMALIIQGSDAWVSAVPDWIDEALSTLGPH